MNDISKNVERRCLDIVRHIKHYDFLQGKVIEDERPDFIIDSVGLEHFLIDVITDDCSINRKQSTSIQKKIDYYKIYPNKLDEDIVSDKVSKYVQDIINEQIGGISSFNYKVFTLACNLYRNMACGCKELFLKEKLCCRADGRRIYQRKSYQTGLS